MLLDGDLIRRVLLIGLYVEGQIKTRFLPLLICLASALYMSSFRGYTSSRLFATPGLNVNHAYNVPPRLSLSISRLARVFLEFRVHLTKTLSPPSWISYEQFGALPRSLLGPLATSVRTRMMMLLFFPLLWDFFYRSGCGGLFASPTASEFLFFTRSGLPDSPESSMRGLFYTAIGGAPFMRFFFLPSTGRQFSIYKPFLVRRSYMPDSFCTSAI